MITEHLQGRWHQEINACSGILDTLMQAHIEYAFITEMARYAIQNWIRLIHHTDSFNLSSLSLYLLGCWFDLQINVYSKWSVLMVEMAAGSFSAAKLHNCFYACPLLFKLFLHTKLILFWNSTMPVLKEHSYQLTSAMQSTCTKYKQVLQWLQWWVLFNF